MSNEIFVCSAMSRFHQSLLKAFIFGSAIQHFLFSFLVQVQKQATIYV